MKEVVLVLDLDDTLYNWMDAYAPGLDAQITLIAKITKLSKRRIQQSFKEVFQRHGSVEVIDAARELDIWQETDLNQDAINEIQQISNRAFLNTFSDNLTLFPNVKETLDWAIRNDILLIACSDGRAYWIGFRLESLGIADYFDRIYVMENETKTEDYGMRFDQMITLPEALLKPNTYIIEEIIKDYHINRESVYLVGDSKDKDIRTANNAGVNGVWAKYGKQYTQKSRRILSSVTHWKRGQRLRGNNIIPKYIIEDFSEIKRIVKS